MTSPARLASTYCSSNRLFIRLKPLRFSFLAREPIHFRHGKPANILRGAFGTIFRQIACAPHCNSARTCESSSTCPYARLFEPSVTAGGPSGLRDWPRPFVFRARHLDEVKIAAGEPFYFDLNLFDTETPALDYLVLTFAQLAHEGLGPDRAKVELLAVEALDERGQISELVYDSVSGALRPNGRALDLELSATEAAPDRVRIRFVTPTELKNLRGIAAQPEFGLLAARIRDRVSTLRALYGAGPLDIDFRGFGERASLIRMTRCEIHKADINRRSSRTGQVHAIGGFVGEADYEGDLREFVPYLRAAKWTGVGRQTAWGNGEIELEL